HLLEPGGEDRERRIELAAQVGKCGTGARRDFGKPDPLESLLGEQRQEGFDDPFARAFRTGRTGAGTRRIGCSHDGPPRLKRRVASLGREWRRRKTAMPTDQVASSRDRRVAAATARFMSGPNPSAAISTSSAAAVVPPVEVTFWRRVPGSSGE